MTPEPYYRDEAVVLYCGDCRDVLLSLDAVDCCITDPPYEAEAHTLQRRCKRDGGQVLSVEPLEFDPITDDVRGFVAAECARLVRRWTLVFCQAEGAAPWEERLLSAGLVRRRWCVWIKPDGQPQLTGDRPGMGYETIVTVHRVGRSRWNGGGRHGVFMHSKSSGIGSNPHPTQKPEPLMAELVALFTDPGDTILDPFAGSGTTLVAAKRLGRKAVGIEINEQYCKVAARRLAQGALPLEFTA